MAPLIQFDRGQIEYQRVLYVYMSEMLIYLILFM